MGYLSSFIFALLGCSFLSIHFAPRVLGKTERAIASSYDHLTPKEGLKLFLGVDGATAYQGVGAHPRSGNLVSCVAYIGYVDRASYREPLYFMHMSYATPGYGFISDKYIDLRGDSASVRGNKFVHRSGASHDFSVVNFKQTFLKDRNGNLTSVSIRNRMLLRSVSWECKDLKRITVRRYKELTNDRDILPDYWRY